MSIFAPRIPDMRAAEAPRSADPRLWGQRSGERGGSHKRLPIPNAAIVPWE
jgi:hypothetical protein